MLLQIAVFMQAASGIRPATVQHEGTRTPRPSVPSCCAVVVRSLCGLYLARPAFYPTGGPQVRSPHFTRAGITTSVLP